LPNWTRSSRRKLGRFGQRLDRIERIVQPALGGRARHEWAMPWARLPPRVSGPTASERRRLFAPDDLGEELVRQAVRGRRGFDHLASEEKLAVRAGSPARSASSPMLGLKGGSAG